jgi:hypothetical protein
MAKTIHPAVSEGSAHFRRIVLSYAVGIWLGSLSSLAACAYAGFVLKSEIGRTPVLACAALACSVGILRDFHLPIPTPYRRAQVPVYYRDMLPPSAVGLVFGYLLGLGFATLYVNGAHLALSAAVFAAPPSASIVVAATALTVGRLFVLPVSTALSAPSRLHEIMTPSFRTFRALRVGAVALSMSVLVTIVSQ